MLHCHHMDTENHDDEFKQKLTPEQYHVCREGGTEPAFSGELYDNKESGMYQCVACGQNLFSSKTKFDSGTGWPSFYDAVDKGSIELRPDDSLGMHRTEVVCSTCKSHLGHVFDDGPKMLPDGTPATGKRYCINSVALTFDKQPE